MARRADDLLFSCGVDGLSEIQIFESVQDINYLIDNLITNILAVDHSLTTSQSNCGSRKYLHSESDIAALTVLSDCRLSRGNARVLAVEFILRNVIITTLHAHYFEGQFFFGVGSELLRLDLERMITELTIGGMVSLLSLFQKSNIFINNGRRL